MNTLEIIRKDGLPVALDLSVNFQGQAIDETIAFYDAKIGDFANGATTITHKGESYPITLATHATDNGVDGKAAYDELVRLTKHTKHPHGEISTTPSLATSINNAFIAIGNIFDRLAALERQAGAIEFDEWSMKGTILTGKLGTRNVCRINLSGDFDIDQVEYNDVAEDDGQRLLTISKNGVTRKFHTFTSNDLSAITDQATNPQPGTIVSNVPKPKT